jgi:hypothetical protein
LYPSAEELMRELSSVFERMASDVCVRGKLKFENRCGLMILWCVAA